MQQFKHLIEEYQLSPLTAEIAAMINSTVLILAVAVDTPKAVWLSTGNMADWWPNRTGRLFQKSRDHDLTWNYFFCYIGNRTLGTIESMNNQLKDAGFGVSTKRKYPERNTHGEYRVYLVEHTTLRIAKILIHRQKLKMSTVISSMCDALNTSQHTKRAAGKLSARSVDAALMKLTPFSSKEFKYSLIATVENKVAANKVRTTLTKNYLATGRFKVIF